MDGSDSSLIEISEEDDSLLSSPLLPTGAASPPPSFACSPLVRFPKPPLPGSSSRRSRLPPLPPGGGGEEGSEPGSSSFSVNKDGSGKENDEANKLEAGKLSLEPKQMKRKKKGAGFNLRKSLAWNRAFFTEEGVLDPSELSMLSGNIGDSAGLSTIQEGRESLCSGSDATNTSPSLRKLENKLSKELPANRVIEGRKLAGTMSPKPGSATRDKLGSAAAAKRKVLPSPDANKSAFKRGGYRLSTALSSLHKPSTGSMTKVVNKGSKLSRLFTSKPDPAIASVSRSHMVAASQLKQNQIAKPVTIQKSASAKITSANVKAAQENVKCGPSSNSMRKPIEQFKRNVVHSGSSANVRHHATNHAADKEAKVRDALLHPAACSPNIADVGVLKTVNYFSQNAANVRHTQPQAAKPSGLRMPSPSLGYFGQSKTSGSQSLPQRTQLCNLQQSGIPTSTSAGVLKPTQLRPPLPRKELDHSSTGNLVASTASPVLHGKAKCNAQSNVIRNLEVEVPCSSKSLKSNPLAHDITRNKLQNLDLGRPNNDGNVSDTEDQMPLSDVQNGVTKLSKIDLGYSERVAIADSHQKSTEWISDHLMVAPHLSLQAETEVLSETQTMISSQEVDPLFHNIASNSRVISSEVQFENANCNIEKDASNPGNRSCSMHDGNKQLQEQAETKPVVDDSEWLKTEKSLKAVDGSRVNDLENLPDCMSFCKGAEEVKDVADEAVHLSKASQVQDAKIQAIDFVAPGESSKNGLHSFNEDVSHSLLDDSNQELAEKSELRIDFCVAKQTSFCNHVSSNNACFLPEQGLSSKPSIDDNVIQSVRSVPETFARGGGSTDCSINCPQEFFKRDYGLDVAVKVHQIHKGNSPTGHDVKEVDLKASSHNIELQGCSGSMLFECKDQVLNTIPNRQMELDVCLNSEHIMERDLGDTDLNSKFNTLVHVEVISKFNERNDYELFLDEQVNHYDEQSVEAAQSHGSYGVLEDEKSTEDAVGSFKENFTDFVENCESRRGNANNVSQRICKKHENKTVEAEVDLKASSRNIELQGGSGSMLFECKDQVLNTILNRQMELTDVCMNSEHIMESDLGDTYLNSKFNTLVHVEVVSKFNERNDHELFLDEQVNHYDEQSTEAAQSQDKKSTEEAVGSFMENFADFVEICESSRGNANNTSQSITKKHENNHVEAENMVKEKDNHFRSDVRPENHFGISVSAVNSESPVVPHDTSGSSQECSETQFFNLVTGELSIMNQDVPSDDDLSSMDISSTESEDSFADTDTDSVIQATILNSSDQSYDLMTEHVSLLNHDMYLDEKLTCSDTSPREALVSDGFANAVLESGTSTEKDKAATLETCKPENDGKKGALTIKPPPDAVPFSEEWLAAFEAAGEEILTMKSGAVQNSPPDKSAPEPSPWSPVRRKNNQELGPFDCTKFAKTDAPTSTGS